MVTTHFCDATGNVSLNPDPELFKYLMLNGGDHFRACDSGSE